MLRACCLLLLLLSTLGLVALALALNKLRDVRKGRLVRSVSVYLSASKQHSEWVDWKWQMNMNESRVRHTEYYIWSIRAAFGCPCPLKELNLIRRPSFFFFPSTPIKLYLYVKVFFHISVFFWVTCNIENVCSRGQVFVRNGCVFQAFYTNRWCLVALLSGMYK